MSTQFKYVTVIRDMDAEPTYTFAEVKFGRIVAIHKHWVPLDKFVQFFESHVNMIDITGVTVGGEEPVVGDIIDGNQIIHIQQNVSLQQLKATVIEKFKIFRDQKELEPLEYEGHMFDVDQFSIMRMDKAEKALIDGNMEEIVWTTYDNNHISLSVKDFKNINLALAARSTQLHDRYNRLKHFVNDLDEQYRVVIERMSWDTDLNQNIDILLEQFTAEKAEEDRILAEAETEYQNNKAADEEARQERDANNFNISDEVE